MNAPLPAILPTETAEPLPALVDRAAATLANARTSAEVLEARDLAGIAYDMAKKAARLAKAKQAHDELVAASYRVQAQAVQIEFAAKSRLADEYDAAQERGEVQTVGGDRKSINVPNENNDPPTAADLGLSRKDIHEARTIRDAEAKEPGIVRQTLDAAIEAGEEPTKTKVRSAVLEVINGASTEPRRGPRIPIPHGVKPSDHIRRGIAMEQDGEFVERVADALKVGIMSYRQCRDVVLLADRTDLSVADLATAKSALHQFDQTAQIGAAWQSVRPIAERIWGGRGSRRFGNTERNRVEAFRNAMNVIAEACASGLQIVIPHLSHSEADTVVAELKEAEKQIRQLRTRIEGGRT